MTILRDWPKTHVDLLIMLINEKMVPFSCVIWYFSQWNNLGLHIFDWVITRSHHLPVFMTILVLKGCMWHYFWGTQQIRLSIIFLFLWNSVAYRSYHSLLLVPLTFPHAHGPYVPRRVWAAFSLQISNLFLYFHSYFPLLENSFTLFFFIPLLAFSSFFKSYIRSSCY